MNKELFLILSGCILAFTIVAMCTGPVIHLGMAEVWAMENCKERSDEISYYKKKGYSKEQLKPFKRKKNVCLRAKALYGLEYSALIIDLVFAFVCALLGLFHVFDQGKYFEKYTGLIGLATGAIGFIMTLVYIVYNGYIFTKDEEILEVFGDYYKVDKDRAFAEWDNSKKGYKCKYFDKDDKIFWGLRPTASSLGKKQYNYQKDKDGEVDDDDKKSIEYFNCRQKYPSDCYVEGYVINPSGDQDTYSLDGDKKCQKLYYKAPTYEDISNKYRFDNWLTNIIFTCLIIACEIGLALFGFLLFNENKGSI